MDYRIFAPVFKLLYGYQVENPENLPPDGPYILLFNEFSMLCSLCDAVVSTTLLSSMFERKRFINFIGEEVWMLPGMAKDLDSATLPLLTYGGGPYSLRMLQGVQHLRRGGSVIINPEGDMSRDGRPMPIYGGAAWLALHTAAPLVPILVSPGAYDIWAPWQMTPNLRGRAVAHVGKPFKLAETPMAAVTDADLARANEQLRCQLELNWYGPGGVRAWAGPITYRGAELTPGTPLPRIQRPELRKQPVVTNDIPATRRGAALLLWRCPVCQANDALVHTKSLLAGARLHCRACETVWQIRRVWEHDFRLKVVAGTAELIGLEMPLSAWYDEVKRGFEPQPLPQDGLSLEPGEQVYLTTDRSEMTAVRSGQLFNGWQGREPPRTDFPKEPTDWGKIGSGRMTLTNRRLIWEGPTRALDFRWSCLSSVSLRQYTLFAVSCGMTPYRFSFPQDNGLKWLTYAKAFAGQDGRRISLSPI